MASRRLAYNWGKIKRSGNWRGLAACAVVYFSDHLRARFRARYHRIYARSGLGLIALERKRQRLLLSELRWFLSIEDMARRSLRRVRKVGTSPAEKRAYSREYRAANRDKVRAWKAAWIAKNPEKHRAIHKASKARILSTPEGAINRRLRESIKRSIKGEKIGYLDRRLGYTMADLKRHLERQFLPGMTWGNRGQYGWHIDHIIPLSSFKFTSMDDLEFRAAWALTNLRPMWWRENIKKGAQRLTLL